MPPTGGSRKIAPQPTASTPGAPGRGAAGRSITQAAKIAPSGQHAPAPCRAAAQQDASYPQALTAAQKQISTKWTSSDDDDDEGNNQEQAEEQVDGYEKPVPQDSRADACGPHGRPGGGKAGAASSSRPPSGSQAAGLLRSAVGAQRPSAAGGLRNGRFRAAPSNATMQAEDRPRSAAAQAAPSGQQAQRRSDEGAAQPQGARRAAQRGCADGAARKRKEMARPVQVAARGAEHAGCPACAAPNGTSCRLPI